MNHLKQTTTKKKKKINFSFQLPKVGTKAIDFALEDQNGKKRKLSDFYGKWVLLYFYPKDNTPGCTKEACAIRDAFDDFKKLNLNVLGVSVDSSQSHQKFAEKYQLPFILLSDKNKEVVKKYGVWGRKKFMGREYEGTLRTSFLINPSGVIAKVYQNVKPEEHAEEVLEEFSNIQKNFKNAK